MAKAPQLPPPNVMIQELRAPDPTQVFFRELVDRTTPRWQENNPIKRGTLYADLIGADVDTAKNLPDLYFCSETVPIGSNTVAGMTQSDWVIWNWASVPDAESSFNAEISQLGDAVGNPVYARTYQIRRDEYEATPTIATASPLTSLIGVRMTDGGSSYKHAEAEFECGGEDAEVQFVISKGVIISAIVTAEGTGFNADSIITIVGDGSGATCVPIIQPVTAILTSQKKLEFADDDPRSNEFVKVLRIYEVLPGPYIPDTRYDDDLGPIQITRRAVLNTGQRGGIITPTGKLNYTGRDGSSVVLIEIQENWSDGTGVPGSANPPYPLIFWSTYSDERGTVQHRSQIVLNQGFGTVATFVRNGAFINKTFYEPYQDNPFLVRKFIENWTEVVINDQRVISEFGGGLTDITERRNEPGAQAPDEGLLVVSSTLQTISPDEQIKRTETLADGSSWPILHGAHTDEVRGIVVNYSKQYVAANTPVPPRSGCRGPFVELQTYDKWRSIQIVSAVDLNTLPAEETWRTTRPFNLPPTLLSIEAIWSDVVGKFAEASASNTSVQVSSGASGGIIVTARNGFRGYATYSVSRKYYYCHPPDSEILSPLKILPSSGSVVLIDTNSRTFASKLDIDTGTVSNTSSSSTSDNGGRIGDQFQRQVQAIDVRDHLVGIFNIINPQHRSQSVNATAISGGGTIQGVGALGTLCQMEVRIPQSTPTAILSGETFLTEVELEEWRFGIWVAQFYRVIVP